ncbi:hypothetical protein [Sandarakinorhabdus sp.]|jgi:hypothetical protein|uniref:hypothetical protein n=1 Tax=Sandarakinorhabdus sp. TaxID=1916663 RepID=UPI0028A82EA7|nr:hypothetical protein [Sandarakinorhabdus sp.]
MADYRVSKVEVLSGSDGYVAERLGGSGWSDVAVNIISYIRRNQHVFLMATPDGDARFVVMRDAAGAECLVATLPDGQLVPLASQQVVVRPAPVQPARPIFQQLARFLGAGSRP